MMEPLNVLHMQHYFTSDTRPLAMCFKLEILHRSLQILRKPW